MDFGVTACAGGDKCAVTLTRPDTFPYQLEPMTTWRRHWWHLTTSLMINAAGRTTVAPRGRRTYLRTYIRDSASSQIELCVHTNLVSALRKSSHKRVGSVTHSRHMKYKNNNLIRSHTQMSKICGSRFPLRNGVAAEENSAVSGSTKSIRLWLVHCI